MLRWRRLHSGAAAGGTGVDVAVVEVRVSRGRKRGGRRFRYDELDSETEERLANFGFTEDGVNELPCQGVKTWMSGF